MQPVCNPSRSKAALDKGVTVARKLSAAGLTLKQSHVAIDVLASHSPTLQNWEQGRNRPDPAFIENAVTEPVTP